MSKDQIISDARIKEICLAHGYQLKPQGDDQPWDLHPYVYAAARAIAVEVAQNWQQIETAPKDGREVELAVKLRAGIEHGVLVGHYMAGGHCIEDHPPIAAGWYFWNGSMFDLASTPTHWRPIPLHPEWSADSWQARDQMRPLPPLPKEIRNG